MDYCYGVHVEIEIANVVGNNVDGVRFERRRLNVNISYRVMRYTVPSISSFI